ncbi:hypothetical protein Tco_1571255 [Tanacetum coccineum]
MDPMLRCSQTSTKMTGERLENASVSCVEKKDTLPEIARAKAGILLDQHVYSISEGEGELHAGIAVRKEEFIFMVNEEDFEDESYKDEIAFMVRPNFDTPTVTYFPGNNEAIEELRSSAGRWRPHKELPEKSKGCTHDWKENPVTWYNPEIKSTQTTGTSEDGTIMGILKAKDDEIKQMIKDQAKEYYENIQKEKAREQELADEKRKVKELQELRNDQERRISWVHEENLRLKQQQEIMVEPQIKEHVANVVLETEVIRNTATSQEPKQTKVRKVVNQLYNVTVEFDIPNCPFFKTKAIIDTGASSCFINKEVVPEEAMELLTDPINVNG